MATDKKGKTTMKEGLNRASTIMEEVRDLLTSINRSSHEDAMEAFANVALLSEKLAKGLFQMAESLEDEKVYEIAETFIELASDAADVALFLESHGDDASDKGLTEVFQGQAGYLLDGLELFADLTEGDDKDDEDDDEDDKEDKKKEKKEESDESDDDDDDEDDKKDDDKDEDVAFDWAAVNAQLAEKMELIQTHLKPKADWFNAKKNKMGFGKTVNDKRGTAEHPANPKDLRVLDKYPQLIDPKIAGK